MVCKTIISAGRNVRMNILITVLVGTIGGIFALKLKLPAGAMVGSMVFVAIFNILTGEAYFPQNVRIITQIAAGAFIGAGINRRDILDLKNMIKPAILMVSSMIIMDVILGFIMHKLTNLDLITSLFACAPGGLMDMSLVSADLGADASKVAILQMVRLMCVFTVLTPIIKHVSSLDLKRRGETAESLENKDEADNPMDKHKKVFSKRQKYINFGYTMIIAAISGTFGYLLKIPAGTMTAAMIAVGAFNVFTNRGYMPINVRRLTQIFAGAIIGQRMKYEDVVALKAIIVPVFVLIVGIILVNMLIGLFIHKITKLELATSLLASAPGGMSDMALVAKDLGGNGPKVAILQLSRYICIVAFFPLIIKFISSLL